MLKYPCIIQCRQIQRYICLFSVLTRRGHQAWVRDSLELMESRRKMNGHLCHPFLQWGPVSEMQALKLFSWKGHINPLTPNDPYSGRTTPLTSKCCILYIYSTNTGTEYFKHGIYSPFFSLQNAVCFIILTYLVPVLFTFYIQGVLKFKKIIPAPKG